MRLIALPAALSALSCALAIPTATPNAKPLPLLIWHGLGDKFDNDGLQSTAKLAEQVNPGTYVHVIRIDDDPSGDQKATFFGNVTSQVEKVCEDILNDEKLARFDALTGKRSVRVDALGYSQGGQFLRGLLQRCEGLNIRSLVTYGSQHNGIAKFKECGTWDLLCKGALALVRGNAWTDYAQGNVVPAQYYRTLNETTGLASDEYLEHSNFLADINNERTLKNEVYKKRVASLEKFVMIVFEDDTTVIPKESGWFSEVNPASEKVLPLRERSIYKEDWLGLKKLDEKHGLVFKTVPGDHMQLGEDNLRAVFKEYFGPERPILSWEQQPICGFNAANRWFPLLLWDHKFDLWESIRQRIFKQDL